MAEWQRRKGESSQAFAAFQAERPGFVEEVAMWPVESPTLCRITVAPPYEACALNDALRGSP